MWVSLRTKPTLEPLRDYKIRWVMGVDEFGNDEYEEWTATFARNRFYDSKDNSYHTDDIDDIWIDPLSI